MKLDLSNQKFGRLIVIDRAGYDRNKRNVLWVCRCDCGSKTIVTTAHLRSGHTASCGCLGRERLRAGLTKHGMSKTRTYKTWMRMLDRCLDKKDPAYKDYGLRGITVCERWHEFPNFLADMGERPEGTSLDRINNDGPYSPENCRWSGLVEQANNKRSNRVITFGGETRTLAQWCRALGLDYGKTHRRIVRDKWSIARAFVVLPDQEAA